MPNKSDKSDKSLVGILIGACTVIILIFHFAWAHYLFLNYHKPVFVITDIVVLLAFAWVSIKAYNNADDPNKDWLRYAVVTLTVLASIWAAAWSTGLMNNIDQGL